ncbi:MAG: PAS domain S-box protein [Candidatus Latescibacteria bacterium]|nr:PAS domain S-box protein [bacterium]MBD3423773.1 PAS domain S-box protein [Candidatus Latescibacterota bacterium]
MIWRIAQKMNDMPNDGRRSKKKNCSHSRQLKAFIEIAGLINERLELKDMLTSISRKLAGIIDCDLICVAVYEEDDNCLYIRHISRREEGLNPGEELYVPLDENNLIGWVALNREPILRKKIRDNDRFREIMKDENLGSDIVVPLIVRNSLIGTLNVGSRQDDYYGEEDLELLKSFSELASIAVANSLLFNEIHSLGEKYKSLMQFARDIIFITDLSGNIVECSHSMSTFLEYRRDQLIGDSVYNLIPPDRRDASKTDIADVLKREKSSLGDFSFLKRNGEPVFMDIKPAIIRIKDRPYILYICHDVTGRKQLEKKIKEQNLELRDKNRKLTQLDKLKREFLGRVSHELRTPLSVVMAYVNTIQHDLSDESMNKGTLMEFLDIISVQSEKLLDAINDLLDLSRIEVSGTMLNLTPASINEIVSLSGKMIEPEAARKKIRIHHDLDLSLPIIEFDPLLIRKVCASLLGNAVKFADIGGEVRVRTSRGEGEAVVAVSDDGPGVDEDQIEEIFKDFTQVDGGEDRLWEGMGIGLRLVKHYVELHGGEVWLESEEGSGVTFYFSIPYSSADLPGRESDKDKMHTVN